MKEHIQQMEELEEYLEQLSEVIDQKMSEQTFTEGEIAEGVVPIASDISDVVKEAVSITKEKKEQSNDEAQAPGE